MRATFEFSVLSITIAGNKNNPQNQVSWSCCTDDEHNLILQSHSNFICAALLDIKLTLMQLNPANNLISSGISISRSV
jgi:hypothetical protein